jgi:transcriptional regulator with XRE-family HTH domain
MDGQAFRAARLDLGLSFRDMAQALGLSASTGARAVRRFETEGPPAAIVERVRAMLQERDRGGA